MRAYSTSICSAAVRAPPTVPASTRTRSSTSRAEGRCPGPSLPYEPRTLIFMRRSSSDPLGASDRVDLNSAILVYQPSGGQGLVTLAGLDPLSWATLRSEEPMWEDASDDFPADCQRGRRLYRLPDRLRPGRRGRRRGPRAGPSGRLSGLVATER